MLEEEKFDNQIQNQILDRNPQGDNEFSFTLHPKQKHQIFQTQPQSVKSKCYKFFIRDTVKNSKSSKENNSRKKTERQSAIMKSVKRLCNKDCCQISKKQMKDQKKQEVKESSAKLKKHQLNQLLNSLQIIKKIKLKLQEIYMKERNIVEQIFREHSEIMQDPIIKNTLQQLEWKFND